MKDNKKLYKIMRKVKFSYNQDIFHNRLGKELRKDISDDIIYSHIFWNEKDKLSEEIHRVKESIINSVIQNKYKKVYRI